MPKKRKNREIFLPLFIMIIAFTFSGIIYAQTGEKVTIKMPGEIINVGSEPEKQFQKDNEIQGPEIVERNANKTTTYAYDPTNKPDPFKSFITIKEELGKEDKEEPKTYLETLDISQLTLSAIVIAGKRNWALIRDSKGDGHIIKAGTPIGKRGGRVIRISAQEVIIREHFKNIKGKKIVKDISMKLPSIDKFKKQ